jgi:hypothetical protein
LIRRGIDLSWFGPPLPVLPVFAGTCDIGLLCSLVSRAEQQDYFGASKSVIDAVSRPNIDTEFPNPVTTGFVIPEVSEFDPIDTPVDGNPGSGVAELSVPLQIDVSLFWGEVVADFVHG